MEIESALGRIAAQLKAWRAAQGATLQAVATRSGVAVSTIQKVERQQMVPTIAVLSKIARGLGHTPAELIRETCGWGDVAHDEGAGRPSSGESRQPLTGRLPDAALSMWRLVHAPGDGARVGPLGRSGEVLLLCESGRLRVTAGDFVYELAPGDALQGKVRRPMAWRALGDVPARVLLVGTGGPDLDRSLRPIDRTGINPVVSSSARA